MVRYDSREDPREEIPDLPEKLWLNIFDYIPIRTLEIIARVCRRWCELSRDNRLWKSRLSRAGITLIRVVSPVSFRNEYVRIYKSRKETEMKIRTHRQRRALEVPKPQKSSFRPQSRNMNMIESGEFDTRWQAEDIPILMEEDPQLLRMWGYI
jgi:hypothetical protein